MGSVCTCMEIESMKPADADDTDTKSDNDLSTKNLFDMNTSSELRLIEVLIKHKAIFIDNNNKNDDIVEFIDKSCNPSYKIVNFINDFDEYTRKEQRNNLYVETVYNTLIEKLNGKQCKVEKCKSIARNGNSKMFWKDNNVKISLYGKNDISDKEFAYHQLMDSIHVYCFHSFDMGYKLLTTERETIFENKYNDNDNDNDDDMEQQYDARLSLFVRDKLNIYKDQRMKYILYDSDENNKFMTTIVSSNKDTKDVQQSCVRDVIISELTANKIRSRQLNLLKMFFETEEYDTDAIKMDIDENYLNIKRATKDTECLHLIKKYFIQNNPDKPYYSFGYRFYYWPFFEENDNEQNILYDNENPIKAIYDPGNKGYKCSEWYIDKKYDNLKHEVIANDIFRIGIGQYNETELTSKVKLKSAISKKKKANRYWGKAYNIKEKTPIELKHIVCLLLYCNFTDLCSAFSATYRKQYYYESNQGLKRRHSNFYHFGKLLRELVEVYGTQFGHSKDNTFYHGISQEMYFKNCYAKICGPMSTTTVLEVASVKFAKAHGIVLRFKKDKSIQTFFMDCHNYSCYPYEMEKLFIGGFASIPFDSIQKMKTAQNYQLFVQIIATLNKMFAGDRNSKINKTTQQTKQIKTLKQLIENKINDQTETDNDEYAVNLFHYFCINTEYIIFNHYLMLFDDKNSSSFNGYKPIYDILFNIELDMVHLLKILKLFENVKEIVIEKWQTRKYDATTKDLSTELMKFVLNTLKEIQVYKFKKLVIAMSTAMVEINDVCPSSHALKEVTTETRTYYCDKCGKIQKRMTKMYGCSNQDTKCCYYLCESCYKTKNKLVPKIKKAINEFESLFNKISWKVEIIKYKNKKQRIWDAICFSAQ